MTADPRRLSPATAGFGDWLDPATVRAGGANEHVVLIDVREPSLFTKGHPAGARCLPHDPHRLGQRVADLVGAQPLVVVTDDAEVAADAVRQLAAAGWTVVGAIDPAAWREAVEAWASLPELTAAALVEGFSGTVLDVREPEEWLIGCVPDSLRIPLGQLGQRLDEVPRSTPLAVTCESGVRSATAASALRVAGWEAPANVIDGMAGYRRTGGPLEYPVDFHDLEG